MHTLANIEDPDDNATFQQGLHYCLDKNNLQRKKYNFYLEIITCDPSL